MALFHFFSFEEVIFRLGLAAALGMLIGLEREAKHKPVGVRVFMIVTIASCALTMMVMEVTQYYLTTTPKELLEGLRVNPTNIIGGVITGIGFLGGAAIIQNKGQLIGVGTGASIWVSGAIGLACGFRLFGIALILALLTFAVLEVVGAIQRMQGREPGEYKKDKER